MSALKLVRMRPIFISLVIAAFASSAVADEGMWPFDAAPLVQIRKATGVAVDQAWLDRAQAGAVRLSNGCSASIVSAQGLVATNHHCIMSCIQQLSTADRNYVDAGFTTARREDEAACPGVQAEVLLRIRDVTAAITAATAGKTGADYVRVRDKAMADAETADCGDDAALRCQAIAFHGAGQYKVYRYRKYTDVRLAFAPEFSIAFFGGDPDNFNFPRFALDVGLLRLYENNAPVMTPARLRWNVSTPQAGEPVFVVGNPGSTDRAMTLAELETLRDVVIPLNQVQQAELRGRMIQFGQGGPEQSRIVADALFYGENTFKRTSGQWQALRSPTFMAAKAADEARMRERVASNMALRKEIGDPWTDLAKIQGDYEALYPAYRLLDQRAGANSRLFAYARTLVRGAQERAKPEANRSSVFAASRLGKIERDLAAAVPIDPQLEQVYLEFWLLKVRETLGVDSRQTQHLLAGQSPEALARALATSKLTDPAVRLALWRGGAAATSASDDPLIRFVLRTNAASETVRDAWWEKITGPTATAAGHIRSARYALDGDAVYPDATFSLRLSYGRIAGWRWREETIEPTTGFAGLYARATDSAPFALPQRWQDARSVIDQATVMNFVTTNDIVGGNSGSPVLNAKGEVIGLAFDGNIHSLGGSYAYDGALNRAVVVSAAAISEALIKVYGQARLAQELAAP